jgi:hypothetical protein
MSALSRKRCCRTDELVGKSLVEKMIEIDDGYAEINDKPIEWVEKLKCLAIVPGTDKHLCEIPFPDRDSNSLRNYVAVSYPCKPMRGESNDPGGYTIFSESRPERKNKVRNIVIDRARRFAEHVGSSLLWIDQECVNQRSKIDKQKAMDAMDRVYNGSRYPVGLLWTELYDESHMSSLWSLLHENLTRYNKRDGSSILVDCDSKKIENIMDLLELLWKDQWWSRAWIFQEEYLGGQRMYLLVRHTQPLEDVKQRIFAVEAGQGFAQTYRPVTFFDGEICIPATRFREKATRFLLALSGRDESSRERCDFLLKCFGKYNVLYRDTAFANGKAMTSSVFADIEARKVGQPYDLIPIAANVCDYGVRLGSQALSDKKLPKHSVGLCALTMALANGELITGAARIRKLPTSESTSAYLNYMLFDQFDPPDERGQLTWLKNCRLSKVGLRQDGIHTTGHLWHVHSVFDITRWQLPPAPSDESELADFERDCLYKLAGRLRRAAANPNNDILETALPELLECYLKDLWIPAESKAFSAAQNYMKPMSTRIMRAIYEKEPKFLSLATLEGSNDERCAIFVGDHSGSSVFTSWFDGDDEDGRHRTRHVSLKVAVNENAGLQRLSIIEWVNGLTFWKGRRQKKAVFRWPAAWEKKNGPSRKRRFDAVDGLSR